jgi:hypothetical protein
MGMADLQLEVKCPAVLEILILKIVITYWATERSESTVIIQRDITAERDFALIVYSNV